MGGRGRWRQLCWIEAIEGWGRDGLYSLEKSEAFNPIETLSLSLTPLEENKSINSLYCSKCRIYSARSGSRFLLGFISKVYAVLCIPLLNSDISPKLKSHTANIILIRSFWIHFWWDCGSSLLSTVQLMMLFLKEMLQSRNSVDRFRIKHMLKEPIENWSSWSVSTTKM